MYTGYIDNTETTYQQKQLANDTDPRTRLVDIDDTGIYMSTDNDSRLHLAGIDDTDVAGVNDVYENEFFFTSGGAYA